MVTPRLNLSKISQPGQTFQPSVSQAGMVHRATAQLGQQIIETGARIGSVVERRRAEEARDQISVAKAEDRLMSESERAELEEQYKDSPIGYADALEKAQEKRRSKMMKGITNPDTRAILEKEFELSKLNNRIKATEFERKQFTKNSITNIANNAKLKSQADFASPPLVREFILDLDEDIELDIKTRDLDDKTKSSLVESVTEQRVNGMLSGLMKGGSIRDYQRAHELVDNLGGRITSDQATKMKSKIDSERIRRHNVDIFKERQEKAAIKKQFDQEQRGLRDVFKTVISDPDSDISDNLKFASFAGKISVKNPVVLSEKKMTPEQISKSNSQKYLLLSQLSKSDDYTRIREDLHTSILTGKISAEDGEEILDSIQIRSDSGFKKEQFRDARNLLKDSFATNGFGFRKHEDSKTLHKMERELDQVVRDYGIDPIRAAQIVKKSNGRDVLSLLPRVKGIEEDQNTYEGINKVKRKIITKLRANELDKKKARRALELLERREEALNISDVPTIEELEKGRR